MYFPILRGKKSEILALKEKKKLILSEGIVPIIELVKDTKELKHIMDIPLIIITNPKVGNFIEDTSWIDNYINTNANKHNNIIVGYQITSKTNKEDIEKFETKWSKYDKCFIHHNTFVDIDWFLKEHKDKDDINVVNIDNIDKYYLNQINLNFNKVVILSDGFDKKNKNSDYLEWSYFTNYCLKYKNDNLYGYSDYLMIGREFIEGGWIPRAVVIHYTYKNYDGDITIRHFSSEESSKDKSLKEKYREALAKLVEFINLNEEDKTDTSNIFYDLHKNNHFTSLSKLKQYSMQRHMESIVLYSK